MADSNAGFAKKETKFNNGFVSDLSKQVFLAGRPSNLPGGDVFLPLVFEGVCIFHDFMACEAVDKHHSIDLQPPQFCLHSSSGGSRFEPPGGAELSMIGR